MFKISTEQSAIAESTGSGYMSTSGVYPVTINFASIATSKSGAEQIVFNVKYNGNDETIYGPYYKGKDGSYNDISVRLYNTLGVIAGLSDGDEFTVETETHKVGRDQKEVELEVIQELTDLDVQIHLAYEYGIYNDEITERKNIRAFFREDGANADEIINDGEVGKRLATTLEKYADKVTYKDGVTEEDVKAWKEAKRSGNSTPTPKAAPKKSAAAKTGSIFSNKK